MADSFSPLLNLRLQQTGGNTNTWGDLLNSDTLTPLENAIAGRNVHSVSGGTLDLSASPMVEQVHVFSGALSSDQTVIVPALSKRMLIYNGTSGAFALLLQIPSGPLVRIPQGTRKDVVVDSAGVYRGDVNEVGEIKYFGGTTVPAGYLECDGSAISRTNYPELFAAIGTTWGVGNGATTFNVPDFKTAGRFLRSRTGSVAVGALQAGDVLPHNHTASTAIISLSIAADGVWTPSISIVDFGHTHTVDHSSDGGTQILEANLNLGTIGPAQGRFLNYAGGSAAAFRANSASTGVSGTSTSAPSHTHAGSTGTASTTVNNSAGSETRPINASAICAIRY